MDTGLKNCPFCNPDRDAVHHIAGRVYCLADTTPVSPGHMLIIPFRHCRTYFEMTQKELCDAKELIDLLRDQILTDDPLVSGFNIGVNCEAVAGQTIFHAHIHLIPRRRYDTPNPTGGVRGVIPGKMVY